MCIRDSPTVDGEGFFLYAERYPKQYDMFKASSIDGPWTECYFQGPDARHGCIVRVNEKVYQAILNAHNTTREKRILGVFQPFKAQVVWDEAHPYYRTFETQRPNS